MSPVLPLPDPIAPAAPPFLFGALLDATFFVHLVAMNLMLGGALIAAVLRLSGRSADAPHRTAIARALEKALPTLMAATITFGVAPLLFLQALHGRAFFTSAILVGWVWLAIVPLAMAAYYGAYAVALRADASPPRRWLGVAVAALLLAVAFVQTTNATRSLRLSTFVAASRLDGRGLLTNVDDPTFWPRYLHLVLGAVAVAALGVAALGRWWREREPERAAWAQRRGLSLFALATAANVFVGLALLIALPKEVLIRLVGGGERWSVAVLSASLLIAVALAGAALLSLGARRRATAVTAVGGLLLVTLAAMVLLRDEVRRITYATIDPLPPAAPQWGAFALFAVFLVAGVVAVAWMVRALAGGRAAVVVVLAVSLLGIGGCRREAAKPASDAGSRYPLHGTVVSVDREKRTLTIAHDDIPGFMPAMTMEYVVRGKDEALLAPVSAGDEITATLVVPDSRYWLEDLVVVKKGAGAGVAPSAGPRGLAEGDPLPNVLLVDQDGRPFRLADLKGRTYAITFVFTRCPMPEYCPLLMKRFAAVEAALTADPVLRDATRLVTVSFDPKHDTPAVLKAFGRPFQKTAPPFSHWRLATGKDEAIRTLGTALDLEYEEDTGQFVHNLRTAVVDGKGRLVRLLRGNEWTPEELVALLRKAAGL